MSYGITTRHGSLQTYDDKCFVRVETDLRETKRLQVLLSKSMCAISKAEAEVELMTDADISQYLEIQSKFYCTVTRASHASHEGASTADPNGKNALAPARGLGENDPHD